jgi:hypothetical protein
MAHVEWLTDERFMRLDWGAMEFFRRVHHVSDKQGIFEARTAVLRSRLYAADRRVSDRQVEAWLAASVSVGLVQLRIHNGLRLGKVLNWSQRLPHTKALYAWPKEGQSEIDFAASTGTVGAMPATGQVDVLKSAGPPAPAHGGELAAIVGGPAGDHSPPSDMKGNECVPERPHTHAKEDDDAWLARLRGRYPGVDISGEMQQAERYVKRQRGEKARLTRRYFEREWLPRCDGVVTARTSILKQPTEQPPGGWEAVIAESVYGPGQERAVSSWAELPDDVRRFVREKLQRQQVA